MHAPKKHLGQNFLQDNSVLAKIIETAAITPEDHIIEIGPGLGVLTKELAKHAKKVTAIELDTDLVEILKKDLPENIELKNMNALDFTPPETPYKVVANIPYNITSPLLRHFLTAKTRPTAMTLLIQLEAAEKLCKKEPDHSILSIQTHLYATPEIITEVPPEAFSPQPKVTSAVIHLTPHEKPHPKAAEILAIAKRAFSQKRKKLSNTLPDLLEKLKTCGLANARPQHLSIQNWETLL